MILPRKLICLLFVAVWLAGMGCVGHVSGSISDDDLAVLREAVNVGGAESLEYLKASSPSLYQEAKLLKQQMDSNINSLGPNAKTFINLVSSLRAQF